MSELNEQLTVLSDQVDALIRIIDSNAQVMQIAKRRIAQLESENRDLRYQSVRGIRLRVIDYARLRARYREARA